MVDVMYGSYYPYLYGRAGPSRPFYQYDRVSEISDSMKPISDLKKKICCETHKASTAYAVLNNF